MHASTKMMTVEATAYIAYYEGFTATGINYRNSQFKKLLRLIQVLSHSLKGLCKGENR